MKEILLSKGFVTLVDDEDFERINALSWYAHKGKHTYYARTDIYIAFKNGKTKSKKIYLHRLILNITESSSKIDHKDGNGLNNCKENLRLVSGSQNNTNNNNKRTDNSSGFRGVSYIKNPKQKNKWSAYGRNNGRRVHIGTYPTSEEAAQAFDTFAKIHYGDHCGKLNFEDKNE